MNCSSCSRIRNASAREARQYGWQRMDGNMLCPFCAAKQRKRGKDEFIQTFVVSDQADLYRLVGYRTTLDQAYANPSWSSVTWASIESEVSWHAEYTNAAMHRVLWGSSDDAMKRPGSAEKGDEDW